MGKWFVLNAIHHSFGLEGTKRHSSDCYFCLTNTSKSKHTVKCMMSVKYPNFPSAVQPVPHGEELPTLCAKNKNYFVIQCNDTCLCCIQYSISYTFAKLMSCLSYIYLTTCMHYILLCTCHYPGVYSVVPCHSWDFASEYYWFICPLQINILTYFGYHLFCIFIYMGFGHIDFTLPLLFMTSWHSCHTHCCKPGVLFGHGLFIKLQVWLAAFLCSAGWLE